MTSREILVLYGSRYGQTAKIARHMASLLGAWGHSVTVLPVEEASPGLHLAEYGGVIIGSPVLYGHHLESVDRYIRKNRRSLARVPSAFFSVSGSAGSVRDRDRVTARRIMKEFLAAAEWHPALTDIIGGAMNFTQYGPVLRWMMRHLSRRRGGPTDTSRDHELTDWGQVRQFAATFSTMTVNPLVAREVLKPAPRVVSLGTTPV